MFRLSLLFGIRKGENRGVVFREVDILPPSPPPINSHASAECVTKVRNLMQNNSVFAFNTNKVTRESFAERSGAT